MIRNMFVFGIRHHMDKLTPSIELEVLLFSWTYSFRKYLMERPLTSKWPRRYARRL